MLLKNALVLDASFRFVKTDVLVQNGKIAHIGEGCTDPDTVDCTDRYLIPGLVDIHTHGCGGADACDGTREALETLSETQGKAGITSFCATGMTVPQAQLEQVFAAVAAYRKEKPKGADIIGINMEGPFFHESKKGAQRGDCLRLPDVELFRSLNKLAEGCILLVDLAPELEGAIDFIKEVKQEVRVSIGHTTADYDTAMTAFQNGADHVTHLFNAMNGLTHRAPGIVAAASDSRAYTELISDGIHIHPAAIRVAFRLNPDRVCLISDSMSACGMPNGEYELGGQKVFVKDKKATLADGTIAGSATSLADCMRKAVSFGIPLETAVKAATYNPAASVGLDKKIGSIAVGLDADLIVMRPDLSFETVYFKGEQKF